MLHVRRANLPRRSVEDVDTARPGRLSREEQRASRITRLDLVTDLGFIMKHANDGSRDVFVQSHPQRRSPLPERMSR